MHVIETMQVFEDESVKSVPHAIIHHHYITD